jgi:putative Holliday junction resolvase
MSEFQLVSHHPLVSKRILALDYGEKVIGCASFWVNHDPYPLMAERIVLKSQPFWEPIQQRIDEESIDLVVVGIPYLTDGKSTSTTEKMKSFSKQLSQVLGVPVYEQDETLSTQTAKDRMMNSPRFNFKVDIQQIDSMSAVVILEDFIHRCQRGFLL